MRCVDRGTCPQSQGVPVSFARYQDAASYLKDRLGRYCSFCERSIKVGLAVEHKQPRSHRPDLECDWTNLLLACGNCNGCKAAQQVAAADAMWPDEHDTLDALVYLPSGRITPRAGLSEDAARRAAGPLQLVGLDRTPLSTPADHRWPDRLEIWRHAQQSLADYRCHPSPRMLKRIVETAVTMGGFSIWMAAFAEHADVRHALIKSFPGTVWRSPVHDMFGSVE